MTRYIDRWQERLLIERKREREKEKERERKRKRERERERERVVLEGNNNVL